jgi:hypothetical protein
MKVDAFPWANFPHRVGLHNSCGTLRQLKHATPSELREPVFSKPMDLLSKVAGIEFVTPARPDEWLRLRGHLLWSSRKSSLLRWVTTKSAISREPVPLQPALPS